eukprot:m.1398471 g.1398471  ORF g.1398471 m.1398471 type:complete len:543 (+) comp24999_c0_seq30:314-1942(+)
MHGFCEEHVLSMNSSLFLHHPISWPKLYTKPIANVCAPTVCGTIILTGLQVQERPTKKSGFSFKCTTEFGQEIFARKGPRNEPFYNFAILPTDHCILRVGSEDEGRQWLVEIDKAQKLAADEVMSHRRSSGDFADSSFSSVSGASMRRHRSKSGNSASEQQPSSGDADTTAVDITNLSPQDLEIGGEINETRWTSASGTCVATTDTAAQRTTLPDVVHTALWKMMSTVTVGKEFETRLASAVPVGLLEPVSCLDKLGSAFASTAILASAAKERDPTARLLGIARWFFSAIAIKAAKLPLPALKGEVHRSIIDPPVVEGGAGFKNRTFVVCEQVSADTAAVMASNREAGWVAYGSAAAKLSFWGNSISAETTSTFRVVLLADTEQYLVTLPDVVLRGLTTGRTALECVGNATISCDETDLHLHLSFGKGAHTEDGGKMNTVSGTLHGKGGVQGTLAGKWDTSVTFSPSTGPATEVFVNNDATRQLYGQRRVADKSCTNALSDGATFFDSTPTWQMVCFECCLPVGATHATTESMWWKHCCGFQ